VEAKTVTKTQEVQSRHNKNAEGWKSNDDDDAFKRSSTV
jgi:hypothetical protein